MLLLPVLTVRTGELTSAERYYKIHFSLIFSGHTVVKKIDERAKI